MTVNLPAELTIGHAAQLKAALLEAFDQGGDVAIDGSKVTDVDGAGLQVLCAARKTSLARKQRLAIVTGGRSAAFVRAVETAGLGRSKETRWMVEEGVR